MPGPVRKSRILNYYSGTCVKGQKLTGRTPTFSNLPYSVQGRQVTVSEEHPIFWDVRKLIRGMEKRIAHDPSPHNYELLRLYRNLDVGGDFYTTKRYSELQSPMVDCSYKATPDSTLSYKGLLFAHSMNVPWNSAIWPTQMLERDELDLVRAVGATAISRTLPTVPVVSLSNMLGELKNDGLPSLIGSVTHRANGFRGKTKSLGGEYLNVEFGWKPLLSDILDVSKAVVESEKILQQYEERSGQNIGRSYSFPEEKDTQLVDLGLATVDPPLNTLMYRSSQGRKTVLKETTRNYWFEGVYTYTLPVPSDARNKVRLYAAEAEKLLGLRITPEVLWNLQPWSWLSDWFFNFGSIATNLSNLGRDNCVLRRGYVMCTSRVKHTYANAGVDILGYGPTGVVSQSFESITKSRRKASPYGFGVTSSSLSARQIAILGALGINRVF
jgi:hypothetical protein